MTKEITMRMGKLKDTSINRHQLFEVNVSGGYRAVAKIGAGRLYDVDMEKRTASMRDASELLMDVLCDVLDEIDILDYSLTTESHLLNKGKKQDIVISTIQGKGENRKEFEMKGYIKYIGVYDFKI